METTRSKPETRPEADPSSLEVALTVLAGDLFSQIFQAYVDRLPLRGDEHVLELGPSAGNSTRCLAKRLLKGGGSVTAVDISPRWIAVARKRLRRYPNVVLCLGDLDALDLPQPVYQAGFISFVLHDIPPSGRERALKAVLSRLEPGAPLFVREPLRFISAGEVQRLGRAGGWEEVQAGVEAIPTQGQVYAGIYRRAAG